MERLSFSQSQVDAIARALRDTQDGLTGSEIDHLLEVCRMRDSHPREAKWRRLHNAFAIDQNTRGDRTHILGFLRHAMKPERHIRDPARFERLRARLNEALSFAGLAVTAAGELEEVQAARTLSEAQQRARQLGAELAQRGVHPDVLAFCREELLADNYFHAVLEAVKSVMEKLRVRTGLTDDGNTLVERALAGDPPMLAINPLTNENQRSQQRGFAQLVRGSVGMFRNPTAHAPRVQWEMAREDAEDLLSLVSLIHRRLDSAHMPPRL